MCDYSLMSFPNRLARPGEELVVHRFACGALGLACPVALRDDSNPLMSRLRTVWSDFWAIPTRREPESVVAVCVPPGARLVVLDIPEYLQRDICIRTTEEVTFTQITASTLQYRDAIRFRNGRQILLQRLQEGQRVRVLDLSLANFANEAEVDVRISRRRARDPLPAVAYAGTGAINHVLFSGGALNGVTVGQAA